MPSLQSRPGSPGLSVTTAWSGDRATLHLAGELDLASEPILREAVQAILGVPGGHEVTVDAAELSFVDSTGLRTLLVLQRDLAARGGSVTVVDPQPIVQRVLTVSGVGAHLGLG